MSPYRHPRKYVVWDGGLQTNLPHACRSHRRHPGQQIWMPPRDHRRRRVGLGVALRVHLRPQRPDALRDHRFGSRSGHAGVAFGERGRGGKARQETRETGVRVGEKQRDEVVALTKANYCMMVQVDFFFNRTPEDWQIHDRCCLYIKSRVWSQTILLNHDFTLSHLRWFGTFETVL